MKQFDESTYKLYCSRMQEIEWKREDKEFKDSLRELVKECIKFTKIVSNERNNPKINFRDCLRF